MKNIKLALAVKDLDRMADILCEKQFKFKFDSELDNDVMDLIYRIIDLSRKLKEKK